MSIRTVTSLALLFMLWGAVGCGQQSEPAAAPPAEEAKSATPAEPAASTEPEAPVVAKPEPESTGSEPQPVVDPPAAAEPAADTSVARPSLLLGVMMEPLKVAMESTLQAMQNAAEPLTSGSIPGVPNIGGGAAAASSSPPAEGEAAPVEGDAPATESAEAPAAEAPAEPAADEPADAPAEPQS
jgi:hypothetical protein